MQSLVAASAVVYTETRANQVESIPCTEMADRSEITLYVEKAHEMLRVAEHNYDGGFYASAVNRAYYAIFFGADALLAIKGLTRNKHSGVLAAF